jgi:hypothetical protein
MTKASRWPRALTLVGLAAMLIGAVDPLEGSFVIAPGIALVALAARLRGSRHQRLLLWSLALVLTGVGVMVVLSALGGVGGRSGRSMWWALLIAPYPLGWVTGLVGTVRMLWERPV